MDPPLSRDCWPCRNRHVRCDQSRFPCGKCLKSGLDCSQERPIRWVKGVAIRGKMQGRVYKGPSPAKHSESRTKIPKKIVFKAPVTDLASRSAKKTANVKGDVSKSPGATTSHVESHGTHTSHSFMQLIPSLQDPLLLGVDRVSRYYLDYYEQICEDFVSSQKDALLLKDLVPLALRDSVLRNSLLALASRHIANAWQLSHHPSTTMSSEITKANRDALTLKHCAIRALSNALRDPVELERDTTIASVYVLILLDLLDSGSLEWQEHLEGARALSEPVQLQREVPPALVSDPPRRSQDLRSFLSKSIYLVESLGSVFIRTVGTASLFPPIAFDERDVARESMADSFLGCPGLLLRAIRFISTERDSIAVGSPHMQEAARIAHAARIVSMLDLVEDFDAGTSPSTLKGEGFSTQQGMHETQRRRVLAEVYKIGTLVYGKRVLSTLLRAEPTLESHVSNLLELLDTLRSDQELLKCVLWPVFVTGLECRSPEHKQYFIKSLEQFWMTTKCLNAVNAAKILQEHWQEGDRASTSWPFDSGRFGRLWLLM